MIGIVGDMRKYGTTNHRQVEITVPWNKAPIQVDEGLEEIIFCLNFDGFRTMFCCKGTRHTEAYIKFFPDVLIDDAVIRLSELLPDIPIFYIDRGRNVVRWRSGDSSVIVKFYERLEKYENQNQFCI